MNKYRVYFTKAAAKERKMLITIIWGYSEEDAIVRSDISHDEIESINQIYR